MRLPDFTDDKTLVIALWIIGLIAVTLPTVGYFFTRESSSFDWDAGFLVLLWLIAFLIGPILLEIVDSQRKEKRH